MQDIELMHMRYALESAVLAFGAMERSMIDETKSYHQKAIYCLKDMRNHMEAINNIPRKVTPLIFFSLDSCSSGILSRLCFSLFFLVFEFQFPTKSRKHDTFPLSKIECHGTKKFLEKFILWGFYFPDAFF